MRAVRSGKVEVVLASGLNGLGSSVSHLVQEGGDASVGLGLRQYEPLDGSIPFVSKRRISSPMVCPRMCSIAM